MPRVHHSDPGTRYVAHHLLADFAAGRTDPEVLAFFRRHPWIDDLRKQAAQASPDAAVVTAVCRTIDDRAAHPDSVHFAIAISRWLEVPAVLRSIEALLDRTQRVQLYIPALLHVAFRREGGIRPAEWTTRLAVLRGKDRDVVESAMAFYGVTDAAGLLSSLEGTLANPTYAPGRPVYEHCLRLARPE